MSFFSSTDFPDRLPPMLVKELRQGLRAKTFITVFLSLQGLLLIILLTATAGSTASSTSSTAGTIISGFIFTLFAIAVLVVQPLRGIGALSSEIKSNTLDMIVLTRLTAKRIVYGKWFALVSQSALILATMIPYLIFRYFFGQMNLVGEIVLLVLIFITSMALTAITVGLSGSSSIILRALLPILAIPVFTYTALLFIFSGNPFGRQSVTDICSLADPESRIYVGIYILSISYIGWSLLSLGISFIAPAAENHSTLRRLITFGIATIIAILISRDYIHKDFVTVLICLVALPAMTIALTERSMLPPGVHAAFSKYGPFGRAAGVFLSPGWPSGVFFSLLLAAIFLTVSYSNLMIDWPDGYQTALVSVIGAIIFPAVLLNLFRVKDEARVSSYILLLMASGIFTGVMWAIIESLRNKDLLLALIWNPLSLLPILESRPAGIGNAIHKIAPGVTGLYFVVLLIMAIHTMRQAKHRNASELSPEA